MVAGQCLAQLFQVVRLYVNHFQPSFQLRSKTRVGAKVRKMYHQPATPCERLLAHASVAEAAKEKLRSEGGRLDPLELLHRIREAQAALAALASGESGAGPGRESLEQFLAKLPELWRAGEARPTHREGDRPPRSYRTRKDPFEGVWADILLWLQEDPESTAKSLLERWHREHPGRFPDGQLRTLQRRIREWRRLMARELGYACLEGERAAEVPSVIGARRGRANNLEPGQSREATARLGGLAAPWRWAAVPDEPSVPAARIGTLPAAAGIRAGLWDEVAGAGEPAAPVSPAPAPPTPSFPLSVPRAYLGCSGAEVVVENNQTRTISITQREGNLERPLGNISR